MPGLFNFRGEETIILPMIELALPAGSLETALVSFRSGADAVYFGMKDFSARKGAINFSEDDLRRIRRYSKEHGKKTYVTVNTLVDDENLDNVLKTLEVIAKWGTDGVIVQDLGVVEIIKECFPTLSLHGSTQMAVHTADGVRELQDLGFGRVVLSRELTLDEIRKIREECPDIELKAFIHGALCYGFSGLCMASYLKCGRSANGGECAQICRSWFTDTESGKNGYFFSMKDMMAAEEILELDRIGIDSAKVEGRLKGPEYCAAVASYYREILDTGRAKPETEERVMASFMRTPSAGYFNYGKGRESLVSTAYPGHLGIKAGRIVRQTRGRIEIRNTRNIDIHDGLMCFKRGANGLDEPIKFPALGVVRESGQISVRLESKDNLIGKEIYKISDSSAHGKKPDLNIPPEKIGITVDVGIEEDSISFTALGVTHKAKMRMEEARSKQDINALLRKTLSESGDSIYSLKSLNVENKLPYSPFIPLSSLKEARRAFYEKLKDVEDGIPELPKTKKMTDSITLPDRKLLSKDLPWSMEETIIDGKSYFTFPPITFNEEETVRRMEESAKGKDAYIGLNNISQVRFAKKHPEFKYFADIYLYLSSRLSAKLLLNEVPTLVGGYLWLERKSHSGEWPFKPTVTDFVPPLFISRACYRHDALGKRCKGCPGKEDYEITQSGLKLKVKVRNCVTVVEIA